MAAQKPRRNGIWKRVQAWLHRGHSRSVSGFPTVFLSKAVWCFEKQLSFSLPDQMLQIAEPKGQVLFEDTKNGMYLRVMKMPYRQPLQHVTVTDLQIAFRRFISVNLFPEVTHGYLRHSPMLTAVWFHPPAQKQFRRGNVEVTLKKGAEKTVLRLIQVRKTVFLLLFTDVSPDAEPYMEAILHSVSVKTGQ